MKKSILLLIPGSPYPPINGHKLKIYNLIKILSKYFDLRIITISRNSLSIDEINFINQNSVNSHHVKLNLFTAVINAVFNFLFFYKPLQVGFYKSSRLKNILNRYENETDYIFFNLVRTGEYINYFNNKFKVFDMVDLLSDSYKRSYSNTSSIFHKIFYKLEISRLIKYEQYLIKTANLTIAVNEDEVYSIEKFGNVKWIPNGVNPILFSYGKTSDEFVNSIAFIGAMHYQPNIDAILWLDKYVLDFINPSIRFYIVGSNPSSQVLSVARKRKNVLVTGFLDDPYEILNSCNAVVSPMQNGGGIQNKILESMALGKINILTSVCSKPIKGGQHLEHFIVEDDPMNFAKLINEVCLNSEKFDRIGENAKDLILNYYTWNSYEKILLRELNKQ